MNRLNYFIKKQISKRNERLNRKSLQAAEALFKKKYANEHTIEGKIKVYTHQTGFERHFSRFYTSSDDRDFSFFLVDNPKHADVIVFINTIDSSIITHGQRAILFFHEPKDYAHLYQSMIDWSRIAPGHLYVVSHLPVENFIKNPAYVIHHKSIPFVHFHHMATYEELDQLDGRRRTKLICSITSGFNGIPGYQKRRDFITKLGQRNDEFDLFGRFSKEVIKLDAYRGACNIKWRTLSDYKYSLVIENSDDEYYISEKIFDALICGAMPVYYGSEKIFELIPKEWFHFLPTLDDDSIDKINMLLATDAYRLISENRKQIAASVYEKYSFYQALNSLLNSEALPFTPAAL